MSVNYITHIGLSLLLLWGPALAHASNALQPAQKYNSGGQYAFSVAAADLNGDGKVDLVVAHWCFVGDSCDYNQGHNGAVAVLLGNGDGTFQPAQTYFTGGGTSYAVAVADVNGDKKPDIVVANGCVAVGNCLSGSVGVLLGNGDGTFQAAQAYPSGGFYPTAVTIGDVNGDKKPDLVVSNHCDNSNCERSLVSVLLGNGDGTFQQAESFDPGGVSPGKTIVADLDGDGNVDLLVANACDNLACDHSVIAMMAGNGNGTFQAPQIYPTGGTSGGSFALADVNRDGKPDIVVANGCISSNVCNMGSLGVLLGNGNGTFRPAQTYVSGGYGTHAVVAADIDGDSLLDLVVINECYSALYGSNCSKGGALTILLGNGDGTFRKATARNAGGSASKSLVVADLDQDGRTDVITVSSCFSGGPCPSGSVGILLNAGHFPTTTTLTSNVNPSTKGQAVTLTAKVASVGPTSATGRVTFRNSGAPIGSALLVNGVAVLTRTNLPVGTLSITATYGGDAQSGKSASPVLVQVVNPDARR